MVVTIKFLASVTAVNLRGETFCSHPAAETYFTAVLLAAAAPAASIENPSIPESCNNKFMRNRQSILHKNWLLSIRVKIVLNKQIHRIPACGILSSIASSNPSIPTIRVTLS